MEEKYKDKLNMLFTAIHIAEVFLHARTGLFFRGGITKGKYYHDEAFAFGPAIISSYVLEGSAVYSRIIVSDEIVKEDNSLYIFRDTDGKYCFNPYAYETFGKKNDVAIFTKKELIESLVIQREILCDVIKDNYSTSVAEKYLWRIIPYNKTCNLVIKALNDYDIKHTKQDINTIKSLQVYLSDFET